MARLTSIRLSDELVDRLDRLASSLDRPRSWLIEQAITRYLDEEASEFDAISEALNSYRRGDGSLSPHDEVMHRLEMRLRPQSDDARPLA